MKCILTLAVVLLTLFAPSLKAAQKEEMTAYLFVYFINNSPEGEQLRYAVSMDGYNWIPLNDGRKVVNVDDVARWKCIRDPHILRCEDGKTFYMVMTDMKSSEGWSSNDGIVMMKSTDLVNWKKTAVDFPTAWPDTYDRDKLTRVWAPQTIYDREAKKYMVYYSLEFEGQYLTIFYSYADKSFTKLTKPQLLADFGDVVLDADIIPTDTAYHMFLSGIDKAIAPTLKGPWKKENRQRHVQPHEYVAEGPAAFKLNNSDEWCLMYDCFRNGMYQFARTTDLEHYSLVAQTETKGNFTPRHGTVIGITQKELERLLKAFPSEGVDLEYVKKCKMPDGCRTFIVNDNPIFKHEYTCDPAPVVWGDTLWLYTGHDAKANSTGYNIPEWSLFSTTDLRHWTQYPSIMNVRSVTWDRSHQAYAAHTIRRDGKYYFYFSTNGSGIGVATSDKPYGPFKDALGKPLLTNADCPWATHSWRCIDPAAFIDDDGQAWLFWGNGVPYYAKLKDNMVELDGPVMRLDLKMDGHKFTEAPWMYKYNGKYYFVYAVDFPEKLAYAVSDRIDGPFQYKGILAEVAGNSNTTHPGIVQFKGKWYLFTHDGSLEGGGSHSRSVVVYELHHNPDGTINKVFLDSKGIW